MSDVCGPDAGQNPITSPIDLTFDLTFNSPGGATTVIPADTQCASGTYRTFDDDDDPEYPYNTPEPSQRDIFPAPASSFCDKSDPVCPPGNSDGNLNGTYALYVVDDTPGNGGQIADGWSMRFTALPPDPPPATLGISSATVTEGNAGTTPAVFTVTLQTPPASFVTVDFATAGSSAVAGQDFIPVSGTLSFAPGQSSQTIVVEVIGDAAAEENEFFVVDLSNPQGASLAGREGLGTILDDDGGAITTTTTTVSAVTTTVASPTTTLAGGTTTTTTRAPGVTTTTLMAPIDFSALIRQIVCPILRQLTANSFLQPFIQPFIVGFGCVS